LIAPTSWVDELKGRLSGDEPVTLHLDSTAVEASGGDWTIKDTPLAYDYPDYRRLVEARTTEGNPRSAPVDPVALRAALAAATAPRVVRQHEGVDHELAVLAIGAGGSVGLVGEDEWNDEHVAVNRGFLLEALNAGGDGQLVLELDGPIRPLAIRRPADDRGFSIIMPVKA
jgi:DNA polymerase III sliding clamp (beta) subunit (PCNA family)